MYTLYSSTYIT